MTIFQYSITNVEDENLKKNNFSTLVLINIMQTLQANTKQFYTFQVELILIFSQSLWNLCNVSPVKVIGIEVSKGSF